MTYSQSKMQDILSTVQQRRDFNQDIPWQDSEWRVRLGISSVVHNQSEQRADEHGLKLPEGRWKERREWEESKSQGRRKRHSMLTRENRTEPFIRFAWIFRLLPAKLAL